MVRTRTIKEAAAYFREGDPKPALQKPLSVLSFVLERYQVPG